jgi:hypothetical protein
VGYNNEGDWWLAKNSWGTGFADGGFFRIGFRVAGVCGEAYGLAFSPYQSRGLPLDRITASRSRPGCYDYKASSSDYVSKIADMFKVTPQKVLLDNLNVISSPDMFLGGITIAICGVGTIQSKPLITVSPGLGQADALMKMKEDMDRMGSLSDWTRASGGNGGYCNWKGVTCDGSKDVINITTEVPLGGVVPSVNALRALPKLKVLDLEQTQLSGTLPPEYGSLARLEVLYLWGNKLTGPLPAAWSGMVAMKDLELSANQLSGPLPASWGSLAKMEKLYLDENKLSGTLPAAWSGMVAMKVLMLYKNQLSGPLPASWGSLARLQVVALYDNPNLRGCIPARWRGRVNKPGKDNPDGHGETSLFGDGDGDGEITGYCN